MGFSPEWEQRYAENTHLSVWPWSDLVSLVNRHCKPIIAAGGGRVLEFGCGAGANIPLFRALGFAYYAIEGSSTIVAQLHQRYPELVDHICVGDFTRDQPFVGTFDVVIDRAAITHNDLKAIKESLESVYNALKPGGFFLGVDWFSTNHTDFSGGKIVGDPNTKKLLEGQFTGVGNVHFSDEDHLRNLFERFEIVFLEEKLARRYQPADQHQFASWNIVVRKPND